MPFLTDLDKRAAVKGSRDPLGLQAIWTHLGRHVVGNLTTVSTSVRDFTVVLLGFHLVERAAAESLKDGELAAFLRWEQLAGYSRAAVNRDRVFRGTERVARALDAGERVTLGADHDCQILSDQKTYGLWGLYISPSRASGLLEGSPVRLTPQAQDHVRQTLLPVLSRYGLGDGRELIKLIADRRTTLDLEGRHKAATKAVAQTLMPKLLPGEEQFYRLHLLDGGPGDPTDGRQRLLVRCLGRTLSHVEFDFDPVEVATLARNAGTMGEDGDSLRQALERIRVSESLLAPASYAFGYLLSQQGKDANVVAATLRRQWGPRVPSVAAAAVRGIQSEIERAVGDPQAAKRWVRIAETLAAGEFRSFIDLMVEQNGFVMTRRNGSAPWVEIRAGRLQVRFRDELGRLPEREELPRLWRHPYFIPSLRGVAQFLRNGAA